MSIKPKYHIEQLSIFGSYARKEQDAQGDSGLIVEFKDKIGIRFIDLSDVIERIME